MKGDISIIHLICVQFKIYHTVQIKEIKNKTGIKLLIPLAPCYIVSVFLFPALVEGKINKANNYVVIYTIFFKTIPFFLLETLMFDF